VPKAGRKLAESHTFNFSLVGLINTAFARAYTPQPTPKRHSGHFPFTSAYSPPQIRPATPHPKAQTAQRFDRRQGLNCCHGHLSRRLWPSCPLETECPKVPENGRKSNEFDGTLDDECRPTLEFASALGGPVSCLIIGSKLPTCYRAVLYRIRKLPYVLTLEPFGVLRACPRFVRGLHCDSTWRKRSQMQKLHQNLARRALAGARISCHQPGSWGFVSAV
jgi:hypothetical protein